MNVIASKGIAGASVLEVGGGIGAIVVELLSRGAARALSVELVPSYEDAARQLLEERRLADRVERRVLDFARDGDDVPAADIVVLHRVVCCYPDAPALVGAAAARARRTLAMTFPSDRWYWRAAVRIGNAVLRLRGNAFRAFVHKPGLIDRVAGEAGLRPVYGSAGIIWQTAVYQRV